MRKLSRLSSLLLAAVGFAAAAVFAAAPAHADVDDFSYESWHVAYTVTTDDAGRAVAHVTETVSPRFPETDQNRGIVRGVPTSYENVGVDPRDFSVTDASGTPVPFEVEDEDGFRIAVIGDDSYVHGLQTYVISYTVSDVVLARDDGTADEFYWDIMDFEHQQPIANFSAEIAFASELAPALNGNVRCYAGDPNSTDECAVSGAGTSEDPVVVADLPLGPEQGVTVAAGMQPGSVVQPPERLPNFTLDGLPMIVGGVGLASAAAGSVAVGRFRARRRVGRGTVIAQYDVPRALPPLLAAPIVGGPVKPPATAQIIHLAVTGATRLEDGERVGKKSKKTKQTQVVRVVDPAQAVDELDRLALTALVPDPQPGAAATLPKSSTKFAEKMTTLTAAGQTAAVDRGYLEKAHAPGGRAFGYATLAIAVALIGFGVAGLVFRGSPLPLLFLFGGVLLGLVAFYALAQHTVHTQAGAEAREHLEGVRLFIEVAEAERIKMLQSFSGAERQEADGIAVIHLYERLLPYAMLFNQEKEWAKALEVRYSAETDYVPYWYPSAVYLGVANLSDSLTRYTDSVTNAVSYTSSSAGGSTGGGFAGGGGGGGFSGGR
ncbi:hypothetical protein ACI1US_01773 [Leucobacter sp. BZR 635]